MRWCKRCSPARRTPPACATRCGAARRWSVVELAVPGSARLLRLPELREWLAAHRDAVRLSDPEVGAPSALALPSILRGAAPVAAERSSMTTLTHLQRLEAESIHIMREVVAE